MQIYFSFHRSKIHFFPQHLSTTIWWWWWCSQIKVKDILVYMFVCIWRKGEKRSGNLAKPKKHPKKDQNKMIKPVIVAFPSLYLMLQTLTGLTVVTHIVDCSIGLLQWFSFVCGHSGFWLLLLVMLYNPINGEPRVRWTIEWQSKSMMMLKGKQKTVM